MGLVAETTPTQRNSGEGSGNPPVTQVAKITITKDKISDIDQKHFVPDCKNTFFYCKVGYFNMGGGVYGIDFLLEPADELQFKSVLVSRESERFPLG